MGATGGPFQILLVFMPNTPAFSGLTFLAHIKPMMPVSFGYSLVSSLMKAEEGNGARFGTCLVVLPNSFSILSGGFRLSNRIPRQAGASCRICLVYFSNPPPEQEFTKRMRSCTTAFFLS